MKRRTNIAERELLYSLKGEEIRKKVVVRISAPYLVEEKSVNFKFDPGTAGCVVELVGLDEDDLEVIGMDSIQALAMAVDVDRYLQGFRQKYDFYWSSGEPYFDD